ncbi:unnamed protein product, partial [Mesorhabditis spiculigera]
MVRVQCVVAALARKFGTCDSPLTADEVLLEEALAHILKEAEEGELEVTRFDQMIRDDHPEGEVNNNNEPDYEDDEEVEVPKKDPGIWIYFGAKKVHVDKVQEAIEYYRSSTTGSRKARWMANRFRFLKGESAMVKFKRILGKGAESIEDGINFSSFIIRSIQKLLNGGTSVGEGHNIHSGPWHFPFIVVLITYEGYESTDRYLWIFPCNKRDTFLCLYYEWDRYFDFSMGSPSDFEKYEQIQLGIIPKDETMKVTSEEINEWTYKRTMEPKTEGGKPIVWTANYRPTFDDINFFDCLKGPLPDMSYCHEFDEMC